ncbi:MULTISPECIES: hypothetical protein [unclassified Butyrivibrio]|uniref:hypothetical protein n=1 Tax=unclassified Butyrivibrio TaxID=2639466 RepID=UPI00040ACC2D|nr:MULTISPECIES: hypothetical protein [unclassified Butyrivibrio]
MLDKFILIGATTLTLSGIVGAILIISWPDKPVDGTFKEVIKGLHLKWKIPLLIEILLILASIVLCILSLVFWIKGGKTL